MGMRKFMIDMRPCPAISLLLQVKPRLKHVEDGMHVFCRSLDNIA